MKAVCLIFVILISTYLQTSCFVNVQRHYNFMAPQSFRDDADVILEKVLDTAEDIGLILGRTISSQRKINDLTDKRPKVVVVGSGWSAHAFLKIIDTEKYCVSCVSPRPYFMFTPMLASTALGAIEYRSIIEPIRSSNPFASYIEAEVVDIDPFKKVLNAKTSLKTSTGESLDEFQVSYDFLVFSPGAKVNDFGLNGVYRYCYFVKEIEDVKKLKRVIFDTFEFASLPPIADSKHEDLITFVVIGGGPTGVEFTAELCDFVQYDVARLYPALFNKVRIILLNSGASVLSAFDAALQGKAIDSLRQRGIDVRLNSRVTAVEKDKVVYDRIDETGSERIELPCTVCVWAAGNAPRDITKKLAAALPLADSQTEFLTKLGRLDVDPWLRLRGFSSGSTQEMALQGSILVAGDCAGVQYLHSSEMAESAVIDAEAEAAATKMRAAAVLNSAANSAPMSEGEQNSDDDHEHETGSVYCKSSTTNSTHTDTRRQLRGGIELLPQTAQVAGQQGAYLARLLNRQYDLAAPVPALPGRTWMTNVTRALQVRGALNARPFRFLNLGLLTYVGNEEALAQLQIGDSKVVKTSGENAFLLWRSVYVVKQVSLRSRILVLFDFLKSKLFGRDLSTI